MEFIAMSSQFVVVASEDHFILWQYHTPKASRVVLLSK